MQSQSQATESTYSTYAFSSGQSGDRLTAVRQEMEYLNTIGKRFVAAIDRFHVHRALLEALQELYSFSACCILLKGDPLEFFVLPCQPLSASFLAEMIQKAASAATVIDFPDISIEELNTAMYFDAPDAVAQYRTQEAIESTEVGSVLNIPLTLDNRIIGMLSLFDELIGTFDTDLLRITGMIADYAAVALENARLRERETALWRRAETERNRLELIIRSMTEGLLIANEQGIITSLNQSAQQLLTHAQLTLRTDIPLRDQDITQQVTWVHRLSEIIDMALAEQLVTNQELIALAPGETVPLTLSVSAAPLYEQSGVQMQQAGVVAVLNDITSSKQVERLKDEFVSIVSHELRTPLTAIKGYTQHLVRRLERRLRKTLATQPAQSTSTEEPPESYDLHSLNIIQSQTDHLERLVSDLLDLSRVQWGQLDLNCETFYLADVLNEVVHSTQMSAEQHTIYLDIQTTETRIKADKKRIAQVIGNLLDNAVKYSPHGGQIIVRLLEEQDMYTIQVVDQGVGVSQEHYDHIFERFYRMRSAASSQYSGIGLGLFVAKAIVEQHGGKIGFSSNTEGIGTTFFFTLPRTPRTGPLRLQ